jgi:hypothetical protein
MMINTPREMPASIAVGQEHSRTDPLADRRDFQLRKTIAEPHSARRKILL